MVRRSAADKLKALLAVVEGEVAGSALLPVCEAFAKDEQDSVRLLSAGVAVAMLRAAKTPAARDRVVAVFKSAVHDESWRVRYMAADTICDVCLLPIACVL